MQIEVVLPNRDGVLLPGAYVQVVLPLQASKTLTITANALMIRGEGLRVAVLDSSGNGRRCDGSAVLCGLRGWPRLPPANRRGARHLEGRCTMARGHAQRRHCQGTVVGALR